MNADSSSMTLLTNNLSDATLKKVMQFTNARDVWFKSYRLFIRVTEDKPMAYVWNLSVSKRIQKIILLVNFTKLNELNFYYQKIKHFFIILRELVA